jgi:hypothetical protein
MKRGASSQDVRRQTAKNDSARVGGRRGKAARHHSIVTDDGVDVVRQFSFAVLCLSNTNCLVVADFKFVFAFCITFRLFFNNLKIVSLFL